jgi:hypothetical protein
MLMRGVAIAAVTVAGMGCIVRSKPTADVSQRPAPLTCDAPPARHPGCYHPGTLPDIRVAELDPKAQPSSQQIGNVMAQHLDAIRCCYERQFPRGEGRVKVAWVIDASGAVSDAWTEDRTLPSQAISDCLGDAVCGWQFPPPERPPTLVRWSYVFKND